MLSRLHRSQALLRTALLGRSPIGSPGVVIGRRHGGTDRFQPVDIDTKMLNHPFWDADITSPYDDTMFSLMGESPEGPLSLGSIPPDELRRLEEEFLK